MCLRTSLPVKRAGQTDLLERHLSAVPISERAVELFFKPFEIVTLRYDLN